MTCYHPFRLASAKVSNLTVSCGQCIGCRLERSRQWAVRCMHEASLHDSNCFITLTYDDAHLSSSRSLDYSHFQLFIRSLRKRLPNVTIRFFMCGEYTESDPLRGFPGGRPHFHACLFGYDFPDRVYHSKSEAGSTLYRSAFLESVWHRGYSTIGDCTFESAGYVARYCVKKLTGDGELHYYNIYDPVSGEIHVRCKEFARMSLKPGIGHEWFVRYWSDIRDGRLVVNGVEATAPRYYCRMLDKMEMFEGAKDSRFEYSLYNSNDRSVSRLAVRESVFQARIRQLHRN